MTTNSIKKKKNKKNLKPVKKKNPLLLKARQKRIRESHLNVSYDGL